MYYVYILQSQKDKSFYYTGSSKGLKNRLEDHNSGSVTSTRNKKPLDIVWYCAFPTKAMALEFEEYLKTGSGIAFRNKHLV